MAVAAVHELDRLALREVRVGDKHLVDRAEVAVEALERAKVLESVRRQRRERYEADGLDLGMFPAAERRRHFLDVRPRAHEHRAAPVAGGAEQRPARRLEG